MKWERRLRLAMALVSHLILLFLLLLAVMKSLWPFEKGQWTIILINRTIQVVGLR